MALISLQDITVAFGGPKIFDELSFQLEPGERVALLGRNGAGKTTLMKVLAGELGVDGGKVVRQRGVKITYLPQEVPMTMEGTVFDVVLSGLGAAAKLVSDYHHVSHRLETDYSPKLMADLDRLQRELDHTNGWEIHNQVERMISQMRLDPDLLFEQLSGGQKRRVLLARAIVLQPDILLLDEPTNHLDVDAIDWLEDFLKSYPGTLFFVTHDRMFMSHLTTRIVELDRGKIYSWSCDYTTFLERKQMSLEIEAAQRADFDKKLAEEEVWIRRGIKARRTRNEGRVRALERLRDEKRAQRQVTGQARIKVQEAERSGHLVIKASNLGFSYGDNCLIRDFSTNIMRGDKIGIIGPNGSGKTTLIRILLEQQKPDKGKARVGTNIELAYYDQLREQLDGEKSVIENICGQADTVTINGKARHIIGYLQDFLFTPERARTPVKVLSGGERNRLLLARLFTKPSNFLVMDEPTNDLDIETLELLEELLMDYNGTVLLVSHDRAFLNNVVSSTIVLEGGGEVNEYPGGYDDWLAQRPQGNAGGPIFSETSVPDVPEISQTAPEEVKEPQHGRKRKRSNKEEREFERVTKLIEGLEAEQESICDVMASADYARMDPKEIARIAKRSEDIVDELLSAFERWEELEG